MPRRPLLVADEEERAMRTMLERKAALLEGEEVEAVTRKDVSAPYVLQSIAAALNADLIVIGSTHVGRAGRILPGSTGELVLPAAPCPVSVAPEGYRDRAERAFRRIGVAYDGSEESRAALRGATGLAVHLGARLDVITVVDDRTRADAETAARGRLDAVLADLPEELEATGHMLAGDAASELAQHSPRLDLLIAGSRRYSPLRAVLVGGVSGRLIRLSACPLIITPNGVDAPLAGLASPRSALQASQDP
jgi:nucleotide-binding universal stress UspA family protein